MLSCVAIPYQDADIYIAERAGTPFGMGTVEIGREHL